MPTPDQRPLADQHDLAVGSAPAEEDLVGVQLHYERAEDLEPLTPWLPDILEAARGTARRSGVGCLYGKAVAWVLDPDVQDVTLLISVMAVGVGGVAMMVRWLIAVETAGPLSLIRIGSPYDKWRFLLSSRPQRHELGSAGHAKLRWIIALARVIGGGKVVLYALGTVYALNKAFVPSQEEACHAGDASSLADRGGLH